MDSSEKRVKQLVLVRHGQTVANHGATFQNAETPLSPLGETQAELVAQRLAADFAAFQMLASSPMKRAHQTAEAISRQVNQPIQFDADLQERQLPTLLAGLPHKDPQALAIFEQIDANRHDPNWRHSDEENFYDIRARALRVLKSLEKNQFQDLLLVSHAFFLRVLVSLALTGEDLTPQQFLDLRNTLMISNTGITICQYTNTGRWQVICVNDTSHLSPGEVT